jgi:Zn-dependent peptidase ImmA (M78 family)
MEKVAKIYKRPLAAFFLPGPPSELDAPADFRTLPVEKRKPLSSKTRLALRRARRLQSLYMELIDRDVNGSSLSVPRVDLSERPDPESVAAQTRDILGISFENQQAWKKETIALAEWRNAIEKQGILVFQMSMPIEDNRGFSLTDGGPSVIVLNLKDTANGRIFSLLHELGHIILRKGGLCDMERREENLGSDAAVEIFCNHFAGAAAVPKQELLNIDLVASRPGPTRYSDRDLGTLAETFCVSREVVLRRLAILGRTSDDYYRLKHEEWSAKERPPRKGGKTDPSKKCVQDKGVAFVSKVLNSHREGKITYNDVADFLGVRLKHMPKIERIIKGKSAT